MKTMHCTRVIFQAFLMVGICACNVTQVRDVEVAPSLQKSIAPVKVIVAVEGKQFTDSPVNLDTTAAHAGVAPTGNPLADITGHLLAELIIQSNHDQSIRKIDPLLKFTDSIDFYTEFKNRLTNILDQSEWLKIKELSGVEGSLTKEDYEQIIQGFAKESGVIVSANYNFTPDYRRIQMHTVIEIWKNSELDDPVYSGEYVFCSADKSLVGSDLESRLASWSKDNAILLSETLNVGMNTLMEMIKKSFLQVHNQYDLTSETELNDHISSCSPYTLNGKLVATKENQKVVVTDNGMYYSLHE